MKTKAEQAQEKTPLLTPRGRRRVRGAIAAACRLGRVERAAALRLLLARACPEPGERDDQAKPADTGTAARVDWQAAGVEGKA
jgi:hypothetical protein